MLGGVKKRPHAIALPTCYTVMTALQLEKSRPDHIDYCTRLHSKACGSSWFDEHIIWNAIPAALARQCVLSTHAGVFNDQAFPLGEPYALYHLL